MPIYEYKCKKCDHKFDKLQKISDEPLTQCPECKKGSLEKLISTGGICLMGHGWANPGMSASTRKTK